MENIHKTICDDETQLKQMNVRKVGFCSLIHQMANNQSSLGSQFASQSHFITPVGTHSLQKLKMSLITHIRSKTPKSCSLPVATLHQELRMNNYVIPIIMQT